MSPRINIELSEATSFKPVPDDVYLCQVQQIGSVQHGPKASYVEVRLEIDEGELAGRVLFTNLMVNGAAAGMFVDFVNTVTGSDHDVDELEDLDIDTDDLIGAACGVVTKQEEYPEGSGDFRSQVKKVLTRTSAEARIKAAAE